MFENNRESQFEQEKVRKLLEAKIEDQYQFAISKNKITHTDFLKESETILAEHFLQQKKFQPYLFFGGNGNYSERQILLFFPKKFSKEMVLKNLDKMVSALQIQLPKDLTYEHRIYLSAILKLGINREKVGDILVRENGADIVVLNEIADFLNTHLPQLTRFKSASCEIIPIGEVEPKEREFADLSLIVSSMRLDNLVAELAKCSRTKAVEIMKEQKVLLNDKIEVKFSKKINCGDRITIRGKGKFIVKEIERQTKSGRLIINIQKLIG